MPASGFGKMAGRGCRTGIALAAVDLKGSEEEPTTFTALVG